MTFSRKTASVKPIIKGLKLLTLPLLYILQSLLCIKSNYNILFKKKTKTFTSL